MRFLITGGAGFIGCNAARRLSGAGHEVVVFDNFSRAAAPFNREWLERVEPRIRFVKGDVRRPADLRAALAEPFDAVLHLAGQVAVTTSIVDPVADWEANALGTFHLLEALRARYGGDPGARAAPPLLLDQQGLRTPRLRRDPARRPVGPGRADRRSLRGGVALLRVPLWLLQGGGRSVRRRLPPQLRAADRLLPAILHLRHAAVRRGGSGLGRLVRARRELRPADHDLRRRPAGPGPALGGRPRGRVPRRARAQGRSRRPRLQRRRRPRLPSLAEGADRRISRRASARQIPVAQEKARLGDQRVFYCDIRKARRDLGWQPRVSPREGVAKLLDWIGSERKEIAAFLTRKGIPVTA